MSSDPESDDEHPEVIDDGTLSEVVRRPTRTAGDLSEAAGASGGITLEELLRRVQCIEEYLGIGAPQEAEAFEYLNEPSGQPPRRSGKQHPPVRTSGLEESGPTGTPHTFA